MSRGKEEHDVEDEELKDDDTYTCSQVERERKGPTLKNMSRRSRFSTYRRGYDGESEHNIYLLRETWKSRERKDPRT